MEKMRFLRHNIDVFNKKDLLLMACLFYFCAIVDHYAYNCC
jgi:hypothetical protein